MLNIEKGASLENKVDQILDMMRVFSARQLNFAQRLNQISAFSEKLMFMVNNLSNQLAIAEPPKSILEEEPVEPAIITKSKKSLTSRKIKTQSTPSEVSKKDSSSQTLEPEVARSESYVTDPTFNIRPTSRNIKSQFIPSEVSKNDSSTQTLGSEVASFESDNQTL